MMGSAGARRSTDGVLQLVLQQRGTRTVVQDCYTHVPLQILRPVYLDDTGTAYIYLLNPGGGVVGGDTYTLTVTLDTGAQAYLTTPSATKIYATPGPPAQQRITCTLHAKAVLTYLPGQTIPFANAAMHQDMTIRLGAGACAFVGEILAPGRVARQERFAYREYCTSLRVEDMHGHVLLRERSRLQPRSQPLHNLGLFEGYDYLGTFYALGDSQCLPANLAECLHALLEPRPHLIGSATALAHGGLVARLLATDHSSVDQALFAIWDTLRRHVLGSPAVSCRT
jgi:urease accessory protein